MAQEKDGDGEEDFLSCSYLHTVSVVQLLVALCLDSCVGGWPTEIIIIKLYNWRTTNFIQYSQKEYRLQRNVSYSQRGYCNNYYATVSL